MAIDVVPATAERWGDVVAVFGRRGDDPSWCWCRRFLGPGAGGERTNRDALHREITTAAVPPGVVAYVDGRPAGWSRVGPRAGFPGVTGNRAVRRIVGDDAGGVWWVACFAVAPRHRGAGVGSALLDAAVDLARHHGASVVEGHPVDVDRLSAERVGGASLFVGTMAMFAAAGFVEVGRTFASRPVVRLDLVTPPGVAPPG